MKLKWSRVCLSIFFLLTGAAHFVWPDTYLKIIPPQLPWPFAINIISGLAEILLGTGLLVEFSYIWCARGLTLLLIAVFPANIYMLNHPPWNFPHWIYVARLPLQFVFIYWTLKHANWPEK
jgi:uncharacterized membrane protein